MNFTDESWKECVGPADTHVDELPWKLAPGAASFAKELMDAQPEELDQGWQKLTFKTPLMDDLKEQPWIATRNDSRGVYDTVLDAMGVPTPGEEYEYERKPFPHEPIQHALVHGNPGIGKSFGLFYALRRLLKAKKFVVFHHAKSCTMFAFVPQGEHFKVWRKDGADRSDPTGCAQLNNWDAFYLLDPDESSVPFIVAAHTIIASADGEERLKNYVKQNAAHFFLPMATKPEVLAAAKWRLFGDIEDSTAQEKFHVVGGDIRAVFQTYVFDATISRQQKMLNRAVDTAILKQVFANMPHVSLKRDASNPDRSSTLSAYVSSPPYDMRSCKVGLVSEHVATEIVARNLKAAYNLCVGDTKRWEGYCAAVLGAGGDFEVRQLRLPPPPPRQGSLSPNCLRLYPKDSSLTPRLLSHDMLKQAWCALPQLDAAQLVVGDPPDLDLDMIPLAKPLLLPAKEGYCCPLADAVSHRNCAFHFTVQQKPPKDMPLSATIKELLDKVGATEDTPLHLFFCVPQETFQAWKTHGEAQVGKNSREYLDLVGKRIKQFVLRVPRP